jgi:DNA repair protein RecO (recombination protein O)
VKREKAGGARFPFTFHLSRFTYLTAMTLVTTPAIILHAFRYADTSKIVRLATREHGVQSAIAKGASRPRSRFGARLQVLTEGVAHLYLKTTVDLQTLAAFDVTEQHPGLATDLERYAAASALAELMLRCAPAEPHAELFELLALRLRRLATLPAARVGPAAITGLWTMVGALGFAPALDRCAREGDALARGGVGFSVPDGGMLCARCTRESHTTVLAASDRTALCRFAAGDDEIPEGWSAQHAAAHRRLLARFVRHHLAEGRGFTALDFWETPSWTSTS